MDKNKKTGLWGIIISSLVLPLFLFAFIGCSDDDSSSVEISLNKEELFLEIGKSERLIASFDPFDAPNQAHKWFSSNNQIASVDETGNVTAINTGNAVIMAKALDGGSTAKCNVTVVDKIVLPSILELNKDEINLVEGETFSLVVTIKPDNTTDKNFTFRSLNEEVATINAKGVIEARSLGETNIEIKTVSGNVKTLCKVSVREKGVELSVPEISNITDVSAEIVGDISVYGLSLAELGVCYSENENVDINDNKVVSTLLDEISCILSNLNPETNYYVRSYAIDTDGNVIYSDEILFSTKGVLKTNFKAVKVYEDKLYLVSDAPVGYKTVDVCYGTNPNPTVTDNIGRASIGDGKLTLMINNLTANNTYYLRSYHEENGMLVYHDDEVEVHTLGDKNIKKSGSDLKSPMNKYYMGNTYYAEYKFTFETEMSGEFLIELDKSSTIYMTKESTLTSTNKVRELYFSDKISLIFQVGGGSHYYSGAYSYCCFNEYFDYDYYRLINITHVQTGVKYIYKIAMGDISFLVYNPYNGINYIKEGKDK
ncbi:MAG: Ig domain-containing protein [Bacteroidaceae bacterium]|nr:Ig domain-containing protein [Bacteroidaceae bacterium]